MGIEDKTAGSSGLKPAELPERYWPALSAWDIVEVEHGLPMYFVEFTRNVSVPLPRMWIVQEDLILLDAVRQIGSRWMHSLKICDMLRPDTAQRSAFTVVNELWRVPLEGRERSLVLVRDQNNRLFAPMAVIPNPEELLANAELIWHRKVRAAGTH